VYEQSHLGLSSRYGSPSPLPPVSKDPNIPTVEIESTPPLAKYKASPKIPPELLKSALANPEPELVPTADRQPSVFSDVPIHDNGDYEIEAILDHRDHHQRGREYLVHWLGYPSSDDEWIAAQDLQAPDLLARYYASRPSNPQMDEHQVQPKVRTRRLKRGSHGKDPVNLPERDTSEHPPVDPHDNQYIVDFIHGQRTARSGRREFLVRWEGYSERHDSWVKELDIDPKVVKEYLHGFW
jgi:hypothetical protein